MGGWALLIELDLPGRGEIPLEKQRRELEELIRVGPAGTRFWRRGGWDDFKIFKKFFSFPPSLLPARPPGGQKSSPAGKT